jgi:hypothetical protein
MRAHSSLEASNSEPEIAFLLIPPLPVDLRSAHLPGRSKAASISKEMNIIGYPVDPPGARSDDFNQHD